jgi:hypothetical protein
MFQIETKHIHGGGGDFSLGQYSNQVLPSGRELYRLQFSLQAASPETFGYTLLS